MAQPQYIGFVRTDWLDDGNGDRSMQLVLDFAYVDSLGQTWDAPAGSIINGASIPRFFWRFVGSPYCGDYRKASVVHDVACVRKKRPWQSVHYMFSEAMETAGVPWWKRRLMFLAVWYFGPRWKIKG